MPSDWPLSADGQYREAEAKLLLPINPSGMAIIMVKPFGGAIGMGVTAVEKGDPGVPSTFSTAVDVTPLAHDDPTPDSASLTVLTPPTTTTPGVYKWNITSRQGPPGEDGTMTWDPADLAETPLAGQIPVVNSAADGFDLTAQKVVETFYPGSVSNTGTGNPNSTIAQISIPPRPFARRIKAVAVTVVTGEAADVRVDLLARLGNETSGNIVGRCQGIAQTERLIMVPGKPIEAGTVADSYDVLAANTSAIVYIRCERTAGASTYTTPASMTQCHAVAEPLL